MQAPKFLFFIFLLISVIYSIFQQGIIPYEIGFILILLLIFSVFMPQWAIYLLIIFAPINFYIFRFQENTLIFYSKEYLYLIVLFLFFIRLVGKDELKYLKNPLTKPIIFFAIFMLVQAFRNPNIGIGLNGFKFYLQNILFIFFSVIFFRNKERLRDLIMLSFMILIIVAFFEIFKFKGQMGILWRTGEAVRVGHLTQSLAGGSFMTSMLCVTINCLVLCITLRQKGLNKLLLAILILLAISAVLFSHTRGAYLSLIFSILVTFYYTVGRRKSFVLLSAFIVFVLLNYIPTFSERFLSTYDVKANIRINVYQIGLREIMERGLWLFGTGLFTHDLVGMRNWQPGMPEPIFFDNYFLIIIAETGIFGAVFLGIIFFRFLKEAKRIYSELNNPFLKSIALGIVTMWVTLFFALIIGTSTWIDVPLGMFFWLFAGLVFNLQYIEKESAESQDSVS